MGYSPEGYKEVDMTASGFSDPDAELPVQAQVSGSPTTRTPW